MSKYIRFENYQEATKAAIASKSPVCVLAKDLKPSEYLVANTTTDQAELIRNGYRPAQQGQLKQ